MAVVYITVQSDCIKTSVFLYDKSLRTFCAVVTGGYFPGSKAAGPGRKAEHLPQSGAEGMCGAMPSLPVCLHSMYRNNFVCTSFYLGAGALGKVRNLDRQS